MLTETNLESFKNECLSQQIWKENFCITCGCELDQLENVLSKFNSHVISMGETISSLKDYKRYATSWRLNQRSINQSQVKKFSPPEKIYSQKTLEKYIGAEVMVHVTKKRGYVDGIIGEKLQGSYDDGSRFSVTMKEVIVTASAPRRNMAEAHISEFTNSFLKK